MSRRKLSWVCIFPIEYSIHFKYLSWHHCFIFLKGKIASFYGFIHVFLFEKRLESIFLVFPPPATFPSSELVSRKGGKILTPKGVLSCVINGWTKTPWIVCLIIFDIYRNCLPHTQYPQAVLSYCPFFWNSILKIMIHFNFRILESLLNIHYC